MRKWSFGAAGAVAAVLVFCTPSAAHAGTSVRLKACEQKALAPDDCSGWKYGVA
jgi:hypothetical protein